MSIVRSNYYTAVRQPNQYLYVCKKEGNILALHDDKIHLNAFNFMKNFIYHNFY